MKQPVSNVVSGKRAEAFARLDALPRKKIRNLPYARIAGLATTSEVFVRAWIEERGHTDLMRLNEVRRNEVFALLDALPSEWIRDSSLYAISRMARTSILYVRTWAKARGLDKIIGRNNKTTYR